MMKVSKKKITAAILKVKFKVFLLFLFALITEK